MFSPNRHKMAERLETGMGYDRSVSVEDLSCDCGTPSRPPAQADHSAHSGIDAPGGESRSRQDRCLDFLVLSRTPLAVLCGIISHPIAL
jgi:hypothetical protein